MQILGWPSFAHGAALVTAAVAAAIVVGSCTGPGSPSATLESEARGNPDAPVSAYPLIQGGAWTRGANLKDAAGRPQARQEHAAAVLNGFVYLIGGFVPIQPPPQPTEDQPEPFPFEGTGEVLAYTPVGHPANPAHQGEWVSLASSFPHPAMHHIMAVAHQGEIWTFGGHAGPFSPTALVLVFTPESEASPEGTWSAIRASTGERVTPDSCGADDCLQLPSPRSAGAAVSFGDRIYVIGGVVPYEGSPDPVNQSIRTTSTVIWLDTTALPLRWAEAHSLHESREHFNAVVVDGRIWVFQGRSEASTHMRGVESMAPGQGGWRKEQDAPVGASANVLAAIGKRVYSFGGEFIASNITGTLVASQVFDVERRSWSRLEATYAPPPLDAAGADAKHGTYGVTIVEDGVSKIMAPGGAATAWFDPMSKVHVFTPGN